MLRDLAAEGRTRLVSLGITPVLAAQLDDPHCLAGMHHWLGNWQLRAARGRAAAEPALRELGTREHRAADGALADFELRWRHGGSPVLRELIDAEAIELLGGPLAHPFQPLLDPRLREFSLARGPARRTRPLGRHNRRASGRPNAGTRPGWSTATPPRV